MRTLALVMYAAVSLAGAQTSLEKRIASAGDNGGEISGFVEAAAERHGAFGQRAAVFLVEGMPEGDLRSLKKAFLLENLNLAVAAREKFPWAKDVPEEIFLNDVLPYASLDETREPWRKGFYEQCQVLVKGSKNSMEAAQAINRKFFKAINVHYNTGRRAPNQSPMESMELGMATCTGLSIIMVDACRSVGVPARVVGTAQWSHKRGNHTWVEIYHDGKWYFTGADEYSKDGLDRGWFGGDAAKAIADDWRHAIWASSWRKGDGHFPMVWSLRDRSVPGVNVTARYAKSDGRGGEESIVYLRLWDKRGGERLALLVELFDSTGKKLQVATTKAGGADLNDMVAFPVKAGTDYRLRIVREGVSRVAPLRLEKAGEVTRDLVWDDL